MLVLFDRQQEKEKSYLRATEKKKKKKNKREDQEEPPNPAAELWFERGMRNAIKHLDIPMPYFKDEESCVEIITNPEQLRKRLLDISFKENLIVIDFVFPSASTSLLISF